MATREEDDEGLRDLAQGDMVQMESPGGSISEVPVHLVPNALRRGDHVKPRAQATPDIEPRTFDPNIMAAQAFKARTAPDKSGPGAPTPLPAEPTPATSPLAHQIRRAPAERPVDTLRKAAGGLVSKTATPEPAMGGEPDDTQAPHASGARPAEDAVLAGGFIPPGMMHLPKDAMPAPPVPPPEDDLPLPIPPPEEKDAGPTPGVREIARAFADGRTGMAGDTPSPKPTAPATQSYEQWIASHPSAPTQGNDSWLARAGETANAAGTGRRPDYGWVDKLDAEDAAKAAAPGKSYAQWLESQKVGSEIAKNNRTNPEAPSVSAGVKAQSAERIAALKNAVATKTAELKYAQGDRALALKREIAAMQDDLGRAGIESREGIAAAGNVTREKVATDNRIAAEAQRVQGDVKSLAAKQTPLAQTFSAFQAFKQANPDALTGALGAESLDWLDRIAASNPLGIPTRGLLSDDKQRLDRMQQNFLDVVKRARTGAAANSNEDRVYARILGTDLSAHPEAFPQAIRDFAGAFQTQLRSSERGVRPEAVSRYTEGGGVPSSEDEVFQGLNGSVRVSGPDGDFDIDESDLAEALAEQNPDGTPKYKRVR